MPGLSTRGVERVWNNRANEAENFFFFGGAGALGDSIGSGKGWGAGWNVSLYWGEVYGLDNIEDYEQKYINYNFTTAYGPFGLRANHAQGTDNSNIAIDTIGWAIGAGLDVSIGQTNITVQCC